MLLESYGLWGDRVGLGGRWSGRSGEVDTDSLRRKLEPLLSNECTALC